jgi:hypothetical protein
VNWVTVLDVAVMGFTVCGMFIIYRQLLRSLSTMHKQNQNTWNGIAQARSDLKAIHDQYAKLYDRVARLEKAHEVHSRDTR